MLKFKKKFNILSLIIVMSIFAIPKFAMADSSITKFSYLFGPYEKDTLSSNARFKNTTSDCYLFITDVDAIYNNISTTGVCLAVQVLGGTSTFSTFYSYGAPTYMIADGMNCYLANRVIQNNCKYARLLMRSTSGAHLMFSGLWSPDI